MNPHPHPLTFLESVFKAMSPIVATDKARANLAHVHVVRADGTLRFEATDGHAALIVTLYDAPDLADLRSGLYDPKTAALSCKLMQTPAPREPSDTLRFPEISRVVPRERLLPKEHNPAANDGETDAPVGVVAEYGINACNPLLLVDVCKAIAAMQKAFGYDSRAHQCVRLQINSDLDPMLLSWRGISGSVLGASGSGDEYNKPVEIVGVVMPMQL